MVRPIGDNLEIIATELRNITSCQENDYILLNSKGRLEKRKATSLITKIIAIVEQIFHRKLINIKINELRSKLNQISDETLEEEKKKLIGMFDKKAAPHGLCFSLHSIINKEDFAITGENVVAHDIDKILQNTRAYLPKVGSDPIVKFIHWIRSLHLSEKNLDVTLEKLKKFASDTHEESDKLTKQDLRVINMAYILVRKYAKQLKKSPDSSIAKKIYEIHRLFENNETLKKALSDHFETGDIVFYDLQRKKEMGEGGAVFQTLYERYSHTGLALKEGDSLSVVHRLAAILKSDFSPSVIREAFLERRRVDFSKIYEGFDAFPEDKKAAIITSFKEKMKGEASENSMDAYTQAKKDFPLQSLLSLRVFALPRMPVTSPVPLAKKGDLEAAQTASKFLCSGFVAGVLYKVLEEVRKEHDLTFKTSVLLEHSQMNPKDVKYWDIWLEETVDSKSDFAKYFGKDIVNDRRRFFAAKSLFQILDPRPLAKEAAKFLKR